MADAHQPPAARRDALRGSPRVIAVVVTYNRRQLLLESLAAVHAQSRAPDAVIVVDNASTDETAAAVRSHYPAVTLAELARNTGGAGGFACGMALALADGADLVWLMDDDTVPQRHALRALLEARGRLPGRPPAVVASRVIWTDGRPHPMNTPRTKPFATKAERAAAAETGCVPIRSASFVSILVDADVSRERGLPQADYFLWNDDFEYTTRLLRGQSGLLCPASVVVHKTATFGDHRHRPGPALLLRGQEQDLDPADAIARPGRTSPVRGLDAAPLGPHVREVARPEGARVGARPGHRGRGADQPAADRGGARLGRPDGAGPAPGPGRSLTGHQREAAVTETPPVGQFRVLPVPNDLLYGVLPARTLPRAGPRSAPGTS